MSTRTLLAAGLLGTLINSSSAQAIGVQASLLDPLYGAGHIEVSIQPVEALTVDATYGRRFGAELGLFSTIRHVGSIADVAVLYSADTDPGPSAHLLQIGPYWQRKRFDEAARESVGFVFRTTIETQTAIDVTLLGLRTGYKYVSPGGFTTSVHLGAGVVTAGGTQFLSTTSSSTTAADVEDDHARVHLHLRLKLGYTFRWGWDR